MKGISFQFRPPPKPVSPAVRAAAVRGLGQGAEHILGESNKIVPLEEGTLLRSGATDVDPGALRASIYYDTKYAARQHEEMTWRHDPGRQAKYLETALNRNRGIAQKIIADTIRREVGR